MKSIVFIDASPKVIRESASKYLVEMVASQIDNAVTKTFINVRQSLSKRKTHEDFELLSRADAVIIAFPLYIFCVPGILTRFLQDYYQYLIEHGKVASSSKVYAIINCGFPEPEINLEAARVIRSFCQHVNAHFRFGVLIGGGGLLLGAKGAFFMKKTVRRLNETFLTIAKDIQRDDLPTMDNVAIQMNFPRRLYFFMGDKSWVSMARKSGLHKKDLYGKPYREVEARADVSS